MRRRLVDRFRHDDDDEDGGDVMVGGINGARPIRLLISLEILFRDKDTVGYGSFFMFWTEGGRWRMPANAGEGQTVEREPRKNRSFFE